jgi:hypothetical protein
MNTIDVIRGRMNAALDLADEARRVGDTQAAEAYEYRAMVYARELAEAWRAEARAEATTHARP